MQAINTRIGGGPAGHSSSSEFATQRKRQKSIDLNRQKARLTLTIYLNCLKCLIGRFPIFVFFVIRNAKKLMGINEPMNEWLELLLECGIFFNYSSYAVSFFMYYKVNSLFRKTVNDSWNKLRNLNLGVLKAKLTCQSH